MTQLPYQPMREPQRQVTQEDMWAKLAKHAKTEVEIHLSKAVQSPQAKPAVAPQPLVWLEPVKTGKDCGYVLTRCGRFSIEKRPVNGAPMYMAWRRQEVAHESVSLGIRTTRREAERLCELEAARE